MDEHTTPAPGTLFVVDWQDTDAQALKRWQAAAGAPLSGWRIWNIWNISSPSASPSAEATGGSAEGCGSPTRPKQSSAPTPQRASMTARARAGRLLDYLRTAASLTWGKPAASRIERIERIVVWQQWIGFLMCLLPPRPGRRRVPLVITTVLVAPGSGRRGGLDRALLALALRRADALVYFSAPLADATRQAFARWAHKVHHLPMPVMAHEGGSPRNRGGQALRQAEAVPAEVKHGPSPGRPLRVFAGGRSERDFDVVVEAFAGSGVAVTLVCDGATRLPPTVGEPGQRIEVHRDVPAWRFDELARASDIVVVTLRSAESACGQLLLTFCMRERLPLVVTDAAGTRGYVVDGQTGLTVPAGDARALRQACERLAGDAGLRQRLLDQAEAFVATLGFTEFARSIEALPLE